MQCRLTRREVLRFFMIALPVAAVGWKRIDFFDRERVCVHVYDPAQELPAPLLQPAAASARPPAGDAIFHVGLPELVLCRTSKSLLDLYPYFWPVSHREVQQLQESMQVLHQKQTITGQKDIDELQDKLLARHRTLTEQHGSLAVIFTLNDGTRAVRAAVVGACRRLQIDELVIFKDPSRPPYLCSYASRQRGFKRPPPIG